MTSPPTRVRLRVGFNARNLADPEVRGLTRYTVCLLRALSEIANLELVLFPMNPPCSEHIKGIRAEVVTFGASRECLWKYCALPRLWKYCALPRMIANKGISVFHAPADHGLPLSKVWLSISRATTGWWRADRTCKCSVPAAWWPSVSPTLTVCHIA